MRRVNISYTDEYVIWGIAFYLKIPARTGQLETFGQLGNQFNLVMKGVGKVVHGC